MMTLKEIKTEERMKSLIPTIRAEINELWYYEKEQGDVGLTARIEEVVEFHNQLIKMLQVNTYEAVKQYINVYINLFNEKSKIEHDMFYGSVYSGTVETLNYYLNRITE